MWVARRRRRRFACPWHQVVAPTCQPFRGRVEPRVDVAATDSTRLLRRPSGPSQVGARTHVAAVVAAETPEATAADETKTDRSGDKKKRPAMTEIQASDQAELSALRELLEFQTDCKDMGLLFEIAICRFF